MTRTTSHAAKLTDELALDQSLLDPLQFAMASRDADVVNLVRDALAAGRARLAFQPVVLAGADHQVAFHEGLVRLWDTGGRVIPAARFMPGIDQTSLGRDMDAAALDLAFRTLADNPAMRLSVDVSARSFGDSAWRRALHAGLGRGGHLGDRLILEISESSAIVLHDAVMRFMAEVQPHGVAFALDNFGAGMTAFRYLRDFQFDLVKIDTSFARGIATDPDNQVLVEALIAVAHLFEMFAVAEGVDDPADAAFLQKLGVDCLQGGHFGVPSFSLA
jgi:EAL domain-containing protein (putative c-di-GMP-specific phosphodiesterase class I)